MARLLNRLRLWLGLPVRLLRCDIAAVAPLTALMLIPISGSIAYAVELGSWFYVQRSAQNAADAAALAAATNNTSAGNAYLLEARAVAKRFGFVNDGTGYRVVNAAPATCPTGSPTGATCYQATVSTFYPTLFSRVIGVNASSTTISASAIATTAGAGTGTTYTPCLAVLSPANNAFVSNGGPKPDMTGCTLFSNGGMTCNGHNLGADYGIAVGTSSGCGNSQISGSPTLSDPYASRASNIPTSSCGDSPSDNILSTDITGSVTYCGNVKLSKDVNVTGANTVITIKNGVLDLNGNTLATTGSGTATVVFSGTNTSSQSHYPTSSQNNKGTLTIKAPTVSTSPWQGMAIYQDPALTKNVSFTYYGNQPTWNISGVAYFPNADLTFSGAVNKAATGSQCFVLVAYTVLINGTADILADTQCAAAGVTPPSVTIGGGTTREKLVS